MLATGLTAAATTFTALWAVLEPAGGLSIIDSNLSTLALSYTILVLSSALVGSLAVIIQSQLSPKLPSERIIGASRLNINVVDYLMRAERHIIVVGLSLPSYSSEQALRSYDKLLERNVTIDILMVNPLSPSLLQRSTKLYGSYPYITLTAAKTVKVLLDYSASLPEDKSSLFRVRLINILPTAAAVIVDDRCLWHPYLPSFTGLTSPYIEESTSGGYGEIIVRYARELIDGRWSFPASADGDVLAQHLRQESEVRFQLNAAEIRAIKRALTL